MGYKGAKITRGLHPSGFREVIVHNVEEIMSVDPKTQAARIAHTVGKRKRAQIIAEGKKRKVHILNLKAVKEPAETEEKKAGETEAKPAEKQPQKAAKKETPKKKQKATKTEKGAKKK
jgi:large subunit ribosomal protein L32e